MQQRTLLLSILLVAGLVPFSEQYFLNNARSLDKPGIILVLINVYLKLNSVLKTNRTILKYENIIPSKNKKVK